VLLILPHRFIDERHSISFEISRMAPRGCSLSILRDLHTHWGLSHSAKVSREAPPSNIQRVKVVARGGLATRSVHLVRL
jgi:hypothetical protein